MPVTITLLWHFKAWHVLEYGEEEEETTGKVNAPKLLTMSLENRIYIFPISRICGYQLDFRQFNYATGISTSNGI